MHLDMSWREWLAAIARTPACMTDGWTNSVDGGDGMVIMYVCVCVCTRGRGGGRGGVNWCVWEVVVRVGLRYVAGCMRSCMWEY